MFGIKRNFANPLVFSIDITTAYSCTPICCGSLLLDHNEKPWYAAAIFVKRLLCHVQIKRRGRGEGSPGNF